MGWIWIGSCILRLGLVITVECRLSLIADRSITSRTISEFIRLRSPKTLLLNIDLLVR